VTIDEPEDERKLKVNGIYPDAVEEFNERLPEMNEGDFLIGGSFREDFKPFVYSGFISEYPVKGESVFLVTERGAKVANGQIDYDQIVDSNHEVELSEAYKVFEAQNPGKNSAVITEELVKRYRRQTEQEVKHKEGESWQNYLEFGTEMLNTWEETYHRARRVDDENISEYAEMIGEQLDKLTFDLLKLADERESRYIENVRNDIYQLENLTAEL